MFYFVYIQPCLTSYTSIYCFPFGANIRNIRCESMEHLVLRNVAFGANFKNIRPFPYPTPSFRILQYAYTRIHKYTDMPNLMFLHIPIPAYLHLRVLVYISFPLFKYVYVCTYPNICIFRSICIPVFLTAQNQWNYRQYI